MKKVKSKGSSQKIRHSFLKILTGSNLSRRRLPFMAAESDNPGPVVWLTACGHGDEVGGIVVVQETFKKLQKIPLLKGTVYAFPLMNPIGFETVSRNITFSKEDLNRSFPGNRDGSLAERMADKIFTAIRNTDPTIVLDLHNDWMKSVPYTLIDPDPGAEHKDAYEKAKIFSQKTGFLVVLDTDVLKRHLSYSLILHDIPSLTLELGESYVINEENVEYGVKSIWNILSELEMVKSTDEPFRYQLPKFLKGKILKYSSQPLSSTSGIIRFLVNPGDFVEKGHPLAKVYNTFGRLQETIIALHDGIVLGHSDSSVAFPGMAVVAFAIVEE
jgi:predicted deacylase